MTILTQSPHFLDSFYQSLDSLNGWQLLALIALALLVHPSSHNSKK